ncbi:MAG: phospho-N-acetylmuramoyl-pentapeptide-transferase, partial [Anaerolineae bacterium]|nr:phospho-N-acetylmuramoyl-pentapeptide-transferase [Anaerolineae bacterium]
MAYSLTLGTISFLLAVIWGRPLINLLKRLNIGKGIRIEGPSTHQIKTGTPTMGGLMILIPVLVITGVLNIANVLGFTLIGRSILVPMGVMIAFGTLGAVDDLIGVKVIDTGLLGRYKMLWQILFATVTALFLHFGLDLRSVALPGVEQKIDIGLLYIPIAVFIIVGTSNSVNLTDGL